MAQQMILWFSDELASQLPLTREFTPVMEFNREERTFTDVQQKDDNGLPLWEAEALIKTGWNGDLTPVRLRMASSTPPKAKTNPQALVQLVGGGTADESNKPAFGRPQRNDG